MTDNDDDELMSLDDALRIILKVPAEPCEDEQDNASDGDGQDDE